MNPYRLALASSLGLLFSACDGPSPIDPGPDTGLPDAAEPDAFDLGPPDAAMPDAAVADAGPRDVGPPPGCDIRPVSAVEGTLTTTPDIAWRLTPTGFRFLTINMAEEPGGGVTILAEVRNDSSETQCNYSPRVTVGSRPALPAFMRTAPRFTVSETFTSACLAPGEVGVLQASSSTTSLAQIREARILDVQLMPRDLGAPTDARGAFVEGERIVNVPSGARVEGTLVADLAVENVFYAAYARDARGVLVAEFIAAPGDLDPIARGSRIPFETRVFGCPITEVQSYLSWIVTRP